MKSRIALVLWLTALSAVCLTLYSGEKIYQDNGMVPDFREVMGFLPGERITQHHEMVRYLNRLADASPRVTLRSQGYSWESRELLLAVVTSPENHERIDLIKENARRLNDPRVTTAAEARSIIEDQPVIVWLGGSIHGSEFSGTEGLLKLLEHLTTRNDAETLEILKNTVVLIDPILNPDGRDAHASFQMQRGGRTVNPARDNWGNDMTWWESFMFRTGHYFFDLNRDWFAHTQAEIKNRLPTLLEWRPQAGVDAHEMGPDVEFYFDPPADPVSPFFPDHSMKWFDVYGRAHADAFDERGFEYTKREMFNYFYPAYTTSYLNYQGAVGMLYEQGLTRGLAIQRSDGSVRTLADGLEQQYVASLAMVRASADNREELLKDYYEAHLAAVEDGRQGRRRYVITEKGDPRLVGELVDLLIRNGIEVRRLRTDARLNSSYDRTGISKGRINVRAGSYIVEAAQPRNRLIRALLEPSVPMPEDFLEEARGRVEKGENPRFYDITAYSLPLLFNIEAFGSADGRSLETEPVTAEINMTASVPLNNAVYAYLINGSQAGSVSAMYHLRDRGYRVGMMTEPTRIQGLDFERGTVIVRVQGQPEGVHSAVRGIAERFGLEIKGVDTGRAERGYTLPGSPTTIDFRKPEIAIIAEYPVNGNSFGWLWYTLDRQFEIPHTIIRTQSLRNLPLGRFDVIVLPAVQGGVLAREMGDEGIERLKSWVSDGGVLVAVAGGAIDFIREHLQLSSLRSWYDIEDNKNKQRFSVPGAVFGTVINKDAWLTAGIGEDLPVLVNSAGIYLPPDGPPSGGRRVAVSYKEGDNIMLGGHAWEESLERMPGAVFAYEERVGSGRVIMFAEDINFRGYFRGVNRLLLNAVVVGPSAP